MNGRATANLYQPASMPVIRSPGLLLQRKCTCGGTPSPTGECEACRKKREAATLQRAVSHAGVVDSVPSIVHDVLRSPGQPLDVATRTFMEPRFGHDFSQVRIHSGAAAEQSARNVNAHAYTMGQHIVFGAGRYAPNQRNGQSLLAHELAHTIQQRGMNASLAMQSVEIGAGDSPLEREADAAAASVIGGGLAHIRADAAAAPQLQRQPADASVRTGMGDENKAMRDGVPYEKWSSQVEALYRKVGDPRASAIERCRREGKAACASLLTLDEVDALYKLAIESKGDKEKIRAGLPQLLPSLASLGALPALTEVAPTVGGGAATGRAVAGRALTQAAERWGTATVLEGGAGLVAEGTVATGVSTAALAVAGIAAIGAIMVFVGYELWKLGQFQQSLREAGFTILEDPLRQAICHSCHSPQAPRSRTPNPFEFPEELPPLVPGPSRPGPLTPDDIQAIEDWIGKSAPPAPKPAPAPTSQPQPKPASDRRRRPRPCQMDPCEYPLPISWPAELPYPTGSPRLLIRTTQGEREWEGVDRGGVQRRFAAGIADAREFLVPPPQPCFVEDAEPNSPYDAHHAQPLYLGGEDAEYNLCSLRTDRHQIGHPRLDNQTEHLAEYLECGICTPFLSRHPAGQTYKIVGTKK